MSTSSPYGRRQLDGPIRRVPMKPVPATVPATPAPAPVAPTPVVSAPTFEYRKPRRPRLARRLAVVIAVLIVLAIGYFFYKALAAAHKIISASNGSAPALVGNVDPTKLKGEGDGRINILLLGIGGGDHDGSNLSDTNMVMSIDPRTKDVAMLSIPRDLYIKIKTGKYGKLNEADADGGPELSKKIVQDVIGVPIHYYVQIDFSGFKQAVDSVGGVDIDVKQALADPEYPCDYNQYKVCGYRQSVGHYHMNGTQALKYARCRKGNCGDDYGRAARQQQVLVALRVKALQASTLTNPIKLSGLIDSVGDHVKTDLQLNELRKLALIIKDVDQTKIVNKVLSTDTDNYLDNGAASLGAGAVLVPKAGTFDYSDIHDFVKDIFVDHYITDENARIEVQNGSGIAGLAGTVAKSLQSAHYNVAPPANASVNSTQTVLYDYTGGKKPYTINYLEQRFGVKAVRTTAPAQTNLSTSSPSTTTPEIRIILGSDYARSSSGTN